MRVELSVHPDVLLDAPRLLDAAIQKARVKPKAVAGFEVVRKTIDARKGKVRVHLVVELRLKGELPMSRTFVPLQLPTLSGAPPVAIVGAGPTGLFCAWGLAQRGIRSVILERGKPVQPRRHDLAALVRRGELDPDSNYCFGEGGAGTFSDGKLYTRSQKRGRIQPVLEAFVAYGAPPAILVDARPHIGTNKLPGVIGAMREHLEAAGVEVRFGARVEGLEVEGDQVRGVRLVGGERVDARAVVVAVGHSARDAQRWLADAGATMEGKPFAIGVRIEHPQSFIDRQQYGALAGHPALGSASYRFVEQVDGAGVFSFCMCPGGFMCPAATDPGMQVVNGWSPSQRRGRYANSGFVTEVGDARLREAGLDPADPFAGVTYQASVEARAYEAGGGAFVAPAQRLKDFVSDRVSDASLPDCSYPRGVRAADLGAVLGPLAPPLREALRRLGERMPGFLREDAVAVGVESRTSCPVRTVRDPETLCSPTLAGLYPAGEGAGYAGGIMSAALDGLRIARAI
jgi:uncharacterized FAD-dependent dehydrogenase